MEPKREITVVIGNEFDNRFWKVLKEVLGELGASVVAKDWGMRGSQEIDRFDVELPEGKIIIEAETYIGISISGSSIVCEKIKNRVNQHLQGDHNQ